jgi:hypothetical protein
MTSEHIDTDGQVAWVSEHANIPSEVVRAVLRLEFEYQVAVGIADAPGFEFEYYSPEELAGAPRVVDIERSSQDAERILGVPFSTAAKLFETELHFLEMRGLA